MSKKTDLEFDYINKAGLLLQYPDLEEGFTKREFTISDVGVTTRVMNNWEQNGLFPPNRDGKRRKLTIDQYVYLKIIQRLKRYDVKLPVIRSLGEQLMQNTDLTSIAKSKNVKTEVRRLLGLPGRGAGVPNLQKYMDQILEMDIFKSALSQFEISMLGWLIRDAIVLKNHISIFVNHKGEATYFKESYMDDYYKKPDFLDFVHGTYISVSLTEIIKEFILDHTTLAHSTFALITEQEYRLLELLSSKKLKSAKIIYDDKGSMKTLHLTEEKKQKNKSDILDAMLRCQYADIEVKLQGGKVVHFENTRKVKL